MIGILKYFTFILTLMLHAYSLPYYTVKNYKNIKTKCVSRGGVNIFNVIPVFLSKWPGLHYLPCIYLDW